MDTRLRAEELEQGDLLELIRPRTIYVRGERGSRRLEVGDIVEVVCALGPTVDLKLSDGGVAYSCSLQCLAIYVPHARKVSILIHGQQGGENNARIFRC